MYIMALWLVHLTPDRTVLVQALPRNIVLLSQARHYSHSASLHLGVQMVLVHLHVMLGVTQQWTSLPTMGLYATCKVFCWIQ